MNKDFLAGMSLTTRAVVSSSLQTLTNHTAILLLMKILQTKPSLIPIPMRLERSHALICGGRGMQGDIGRCQGPHLILSHFSQ